MTHAENIHGPQPLLYALAAFAIGIAAAGSLNLSLWCGVFAAAAVAAIAVRGRFPVFPFVLVVFVSLGAVCAGLSANKPNDTSLRAMLDGGRIAAGEVVEYEGVVASLPDVSRDAVVVELDVER